MPYTAEEEQQLADRYYRKFRAWPWPPLNLGWDGERVEVWGPLAEQALKDGTAIDWKARRRPLPAGARS